MNNSKREATLKKVAELKAKVEAFKEETQAKNEKFFKEAVAFLFEEHPVLESFHWVQYTPYFMDGDECIFSARTDDISINDYEDHEGTWGIKQLIEKASNPAEQTHLKAKLAGLQSQLDKAVGAKNFAEAQSLQRQISSTEYEIVEDVDVANLKQQLAAIEDIQEVMNAFDDELFRTLFGDHVRVTVYKDTIDIEEYEHD